VSGEGIWVPDCPYKLKGTSIRVERLETESQCWTKSSDTAHCGNCSNDPVLKFDLGLAINSQFETHCDQTLE